jgi:hypothetical protein
LTYSTVDREVGVRYSDWGERVRVHRPAAEQILRVPGTSATDT